MTHRSHDNGFRHLTASHEMQHACPSCDRSAAVQASRSQEAGRLRKLPAVCYSSLNCPAVLQGGALTLHSKA